jgi:hypothetical protein
MKTLPSDVFIVSLLTIVVLGWLVGIVFWGLIGRILK